MKWGDKDKVRQQGFRERERARKRDREKNSRQ
jgi:hypothetical protein